MKRMSFLPVTAGDFALREGSGERQWNKVSQQIQRLELEADKLQAIVNGLKRVLKDADQFGVTRDPTSRQRFQAEIAANERDLEVYRKTITSYREAVEMGTSQIGFGDQRYVDDDGCRRRFREVFNREVELAAAGGDSSARGLRARASSRFCGAPTPSRTALETTKKQARGRRRRAGSGPEAAGRPGGRQHREIRARISTGWISKPGSWSARWR